MEQQDQEINLADLFSLLLSKIQIIILATLFGLVLAFAFAKLILPVEYTSSLSIYVMSKESSTQTSGQTTQADLTTAKSLAETYIVILNEDVIYDQVSQKLIDNYSIDTLEQYFAIDKSGDEYSIKADSIRNLVTISTVDETEVINISTTSENPQISADICTYISEVAQDILIQVTKAGSVEPIGEAKVPESPSAPNVTKISLIGALIGLVLSIAVIIIMNLLDNCISSADDIRQKYSLPVLAEIPDFELAEKEGHKYEYKAK